MSEYTVLGTTDDTTTCECCGKSNLKMTVVLRTEDNDVTYFGRACAARAMGRTAAQVNRSIAAAEHEVEEARYLLERWSRYITPEGVNVALFQQNNTAARNWTPEEIEARILKVVFESRARLALAA